MSPSPNQSDREDHVTKPEMKKKTIVEKENEMARTLLLGSSSSDDEASQTDPYRVKVVQELQPPDLEKRRRYCEWFRAFTRNNIPHHPQIFRNKSASGVQYREEGLLGPFFMTQQSMVPCIGILCINLWLCWKRTSVTVGFNEISHSIAEITPETLRKVSRNMRRRVELCLQENGGHFQHLL
ncbi:hypothetical protein C0J52_12393 [Blattella germanica]|nr:hypothetical protein C0J52_12393 [Blattella germanica]